MFRIEQPEALIFLVLVPVLWVFLRFIRRRARGRMDILGNDESVQMMVPGFNARKILFKHRVILLAVTFLIMAVANPQVGLEKEEVETKSADVFIALDVSRSMLAEDVQPSRMARAKRLGNSLIRELRTERIGLISFGGNAYLHMPLTSDTRAAMTFLETMDPEIAATQGTDIGKALELAASSFDAQAKTHPVLVLITDGEDHEEGTERAIEKIKEKGVYVFIVGIGGQEGAYIPVSRVSGDGFHRDKNGSLVRTRLNEDLLRDIADQLNGSYYSFANENALIEAIESRIGILDKIALERRSFSTYRSFFQYFLLGAVFCLVWVFGSPNRRADV